MPRTSETSELTAKTVNVLNAMAEQYGIVDFKAVASGNTVKMSIPGLTNPEFADGFEFAFSARTPAGKAAIGETKYSKIECIAGLAKFISETGIQSASKYNSWAKAPEQKEAKIPNTHAVMLTLGVWPAQTITKLMLKGILNETEAEDVIKMQIEYNEKVKAEKPEKTDNKTEEVTVTND